MNTTATDKPRGSQINALDSVTMHVVRVLLQLPVRNTLNATTSPWISDVRRHVCVSNASAKHVSMKSSQVYTTMKTKANVRHTKSYSASSAEEQAHVTKNIFSLLLITNSTQGKAIIRMNDECQ